MSAEQSGDVQTIPDELVPLATEARTRRWLIESYEFAYEARVRRLNGYKLLLEFTSVLFAILFLFLQYVAKGNSATIHDALGLIGTGMSLAIILMVIWGYMDRWTDQVEKKRELARECRDLLKQYTKLFAARPIVSSKIRSWMDACDEFEGQRRHELATLPRRYLQAGHQHIGNTHGRFGVFCTSCEREWKTEMNRPGFKARWFKTKCIGCGVPYDQASR